VKAAGSNGPAPSWSFLLVGLAAFAFLLSGYIRVWTPQYGITKFLLAGREFDARGLAVYRATPKYLDPRPAGRWGFDGQFYAELALDPLLRDPQLSLAMDGPVYRSRRILLSWLAWCGGLGRPFWVLNVYAALNLVFWVGYAWLAARLFRPHGWAGLAGYAAVLLTCGIIECVHASLADCPSFVLMLAAAVLGGTGGASVLALATLARETSVLGLAALVELARPWREALGRNLRLGAIVVLPLALWMGYVLWRFHFKQIDFAGGNLEPPLRGIVQALGELTVTLGRVRWSRWWFEIYKSYELHGLLTVVSVVTQCAYLALHREWGSRLWRLAAIGALYFLCIGYTTWKTHFTVTRHALPVTFVFNLLLATRPGRGWAAWFVLGNCFVPYGLRFFLLTSG